MSPPQVHKIRAIASVARLLVIAGCMYIQYQSSRSRSDVMTAACSQWRDKVSLDALREVIADQQLLLTECPHLAPVPTASSAELQAERQTLSAR